VSNVATPDPDPGAGAGPGFRISGPGPDTGGGGGLQKPEHLGHLLFFVAPVAETRTGNDGKSYDVALCAYAGCISDHTAWADLPVSGTALVPRLTSGEGEIIAGILNQLEGRAGKTGAYVLEEPTEGDLDKIQATFSKCATRLPAGKIVFDVESFNAGPAF
jgi:hypothetical protein